MSTVEISTSALQTQPAEISRRVALRFAELALPAWEARHPTDLRPRRAIEAAKAYRADPSEENLTHLFVCVDEVVMASRVDEYSYDCSAWAIATTTWAVSSDCERP